MSVWKLVWRQLRASGPLGVVASAGIFLSVVLLATGPLYIETLERLAFDRALTALRTSIHPQVYLGFSSFAASEYEQARADVVAAAERSFGDAFESHGVHASTRILGTELVEPRGFQSFSFFQYRTDIEQHVDVVEGRMPVSAGVDGVIEVVIGRNAAEVVGGVWVGQTLRQTASLPPPRPVFEAKIVGVVEPRDLDDPYWLAQGFAYFEAYEVANRWVFPLFSPLQIV